MATPPTPQFPELFKGLGSKLVRGLMEQVAECTNPISPLESISNIVMRVKTNGMCRWMLPQI